MKEKRFIYSPHRIAVAILFLLMTAHALFAQAPPDGDASQQRLKRARALMAAHKLGAAAAELDALRIATADDSVRDVARIMLMSVYLEEGDYMRAQNLLEETYKQRSAQNENSSRTYFALAGQAVGSTREHLGRYRSFGINVADKELPPEAANDLDHMRMLLERVAEQAREMCSQNEKSFDALGLLEEVATVRGTLARNKQERLQWQGEVAHARQKLAANEPLLASAGKLPTNPVSMTSSPAVTTSAPPASSPSAKPNHAPDLAVKKTGAAVPESRNAAPPIQSTPSDSAPGASAPATPVRPVEVGSLIDKATQRVNPSYPQTAKSARITGVVKVYLEIDENGSVAAIQRTDGPVMLRQAAMEAARRWKFRPTVVSGQPVRTLGFLSFNFTL